MATQTTTTITVAGEGITVSLLVWRLLKRKPEGYVERVLDMNPGIAAVGPFLPIGTKVVLPVDYEDVSSSADSVVTLWD